MFYCGLLRIVYALMMENAYAPAEPNQMASYAPPAAPQFEHFARAGLPPASTNTAPSWRPRPNTSELVHPPSVTENTTRLLDKEDQTNK